MLTTGAASARRNWYLASLGIVRYVPRDEVVPDEAPDDSVSRQHVSPLEEVRDAPAPAEADVVRQGARGAEVLAALDSAPSLVRPQEMGSSDRVRSANKGPLAVPAAAGIEPSAEPFLCRLGFWQPASVAVISAMPPAQRPTPVQITMLTNLLKAIGAVGQGLPSVDLIDWPPSSGLGLQGGATLAAAREYLSVFLQAKQRLQNYETVLLMGEVAAQACGIDATFEAGYQHDFAWGGRGIVTHSLHDMEKTPSLKAETWQAIRFLAD